MYVRRLVETCHIDLILDIGANVGQFATTMRQIGYKGDIISFEPLATEYLTLSKKAATDPRWVTFNLALSDTNEEKSLNVTRSSVFSSFRTPSSDATDEFALFNNVVRTETVPTQRADQFLSANNLEGRLQSCFVKCDTQGHDLNVLKGFGASLVNVRMLLVEISSIPLYQDAPTMLEALKFLNEAHFSMISLFPIGRLRDGRTVEFDYLGVHQ
jgi:FkbM family methyltransferase